MIEDKSRRLSWRVVAATLLFAALVITGLRPFYARFLAADRQGWARHFDAFPDRRAPGYVDLLREAGARIPMGSRVAVVFPTLDWPRGYSYAYYRAQYLLAGRVVIPLSWVDGPRVSRIEEAEYLVVYRSVLPRVEWEVLFENGDGAVVRRTR